LADIHVDYCHFTSNNISFYKKRGHREFFRRKSSIKIKELKKYPISITAYNRKEDNQLIKPKVFDGYIWKIEIANKSWFNKKTIENLKTSIFLKNIDDPIELRWSSRLTDPKDCMIRIGLSEDDIREEYLKRLGYEYGIVICSVGREHTILHPNNKDELYFLVSFKELDYVFIITPNGTIAWEDNILTCRYGEALLMFPISSSQKIRIKFDNEDKTRKYNLILNSYNDIKLK
jgi:hypothetical protein